MSNETFTLERTPTTTSPQVTDKGTVVPLPYGMGLMLDGALGVKKPEDGYALKRW